MLKCNKRLTLAKFFSFLDDICDRQTISLLEVSINNFFNH